MLHQAIDAARSFRPFTEAQRTALLCKTEQVARAGEFELYKTNHCFDGTYHKPEWLD